MKIKRVATSMSYRIQRKVYYRERDMLHDKMLIYKEDKKF